VESSSEAEARGFPGVDTGLREAARAWGRRIVPGLRCGAWTEAAVNRASRKVGERCRRANVVPRRPRQKSPHRRPGLLGCVHRCRYGEGPIQSWPAQGRRSGAFAFAFVTPGKEGRGQHARERVNTETIAAQGEGVCSTDSGDARSNAQVPRVSRSHVRQKTRTTGTGKRPGSD